MKKICFLATVPDVLFSFMRGHITAVSAQMSVTLISAPSRRELLEGLDAEFIPLKVSREIALFSDLKSFITLIIIFRKENFQIVHTIMPKTGLVGMMAAWFSDVPIRIHSFTGQIWANKTGYKRIFFKLVDRAIVLFSSHILVDSPSQRDFLESEGILRKDQAVVLGHGSICGVDTEKFYPDSNIKDKLRVDLGITPDQILILYLGRLNKDKGILDLVDAFRQIVAMNNKVFLALVGSEDGLDYEDILIRAADASSFLRRVPFTAYPEKYMAAADIFALPSYREGFGQVIIEAAACSVPTVASNIYGISDAVENGRTGLLFEMANIGELKAALLRLIESPDLRRQLGEAAKERTLSRFNSKTVICNQLTFYKAALEQAKPKIKLRGIL